MNIQNLKIIAKKSFHERIVCLILLMEKQSRIKLPWKILRKLINQGIYHVEIHPDSFKNCEAIASLMLPHPYVIIIHRSCTIGMGCRIFQNVTLGVIEKENVPILAPQIGDYVYIGAGCVILGNVFIGDRARCGANATVLTSVPCNGVAVGIYK